MLVPTSVFSHRYVRDLLLNPPAYEIALTIQGGSLAYMWPYLQLYMTILIFAIQQFTYYPFNGPASTHSRFSSLGHTPLLLQFIQNNVI